MRRTGPLAVLFLLAMVLIPGGPAAAQADPCIDILEGEVPDGYAVVYTPEQGGSGRQVVIGTNGDDVLVGGSGDDILCGLGGNDVFYGGSGDDVLSAGVGINELYGGSGDDILFGMSYDVIDGGSGHNTIHVP